VIWKIDITDANICEIFNTAAVDFCSKGVKTFTCVLAYLRRININIVVKGIFIAYHIF
jgi:hypothetical protein